MRAPPAFALALLLAAAPAGLAAVTGGRAMEDCVRNATVVAYECSWTRYRPDWCKNEYCVSQSWFRPVATLAMSDGLTPEATLKCSDEDKANKLCVTKNAYGDDNVLGASEVTSKYEGMLDKCPTVQYDLGTSSGYRMWIEGGTINSTAAYFIQFCWGAALGKAEACDGLQHMAEYYRDGRGSVIVALKLEDPDKVTNLATCAHQNGVAGTASGALRGALVPSRATAGLVVVAAWGLVRLLTF